jgi:hypothetical protein
MEVCSLSREVMFQLLSLSLQEGIRLLHLPLPATPSASLASRFPMQESIGLTLFRMCVRMG